MRDLFAEGVDLLITADCGISNRSEVALANELGMEVVVTDHHIPPEDPPDTAVAVLDPKLWNPEDPLAGGGGLPGSSPGPSPAGSATPRAGNVWDGF